MAAALRIDEIGQPEARSRRSRSGVARTRSFQVRRFWRDGRHFCIFVARRVGCMRHSQHRRLWGRLRRFIPRRWGRCVGVARSVRRAGVAHAGDLPGGDSPRPEVTPRSWHVARPCVVRPRGMPREEGCAKRKQRSRTYAARCLVAAALDFNLGHSPEVLTRSCDNCPCRRDEI